MGLVGKRALITGSSTGLGQSIAESLAAEGASVVIHGRDEARTIAVADGIRATGGDATVTLGDLATSAGAADTAKVAGEIDILVNNAGYYDGLSWSEATADQWLEMYQTNVVSGVRMIDSLVPGMRGRLHQRR
jgi:3-oxoacyl-[acyl-carrier protein] reductase